MALGNDVTLKVGFDIDKFQAELAKANGILGSWQKGVIRTLSGIGIGMSAKQMGTEMIQVTAQFQKFEAILGNTLGSNSQAQQALKEIRQFAIETPFEVAEVTAAYVRWANMGLDPTIERMGKLGDIASSLGAGFEQTAEAFKDLMVGQTKRIEEIGISAQQANGKIQLSFKGVTIEIDKNKEGVQKALDVYSQLNGVLGTSDAVAKTLGGQISALSDAYKNLLLTWGNESGGLMGTFITDATTFLNILSHADLSAADKFKMIFGSFSGAGEELKKVNDELKKNNDLLKASISLQADQAIQTFGFNLKTIGDAYKQNVNFAAIMEEVQSRLNKKTAEEAEIIAKAAVAQAEHNKKLQARKDLIEQILRAQAIQAKFDAESSKSVTPDGIPQGHQSIAMPDKVGSPYSMGISPEILDQNAKNIDRHHENVERLMEINEQLKLSWENVAIAVSSLAVDVIGDMAEALSAGEPVGQAFLKSLAKFGIQFGKQLIQLGAAKVALGIIEKNPAAVGQGLKAIAAGAALTAGSAALAASQSGAGRVGGGDSSYNSGGGRGSVNGNTQTNVNITGELKADGSVLLAVIRNATQDNKIRKG